MALRLTGLPLTLLKFNGLRISSEGQTQLMNNFQRAQT